jgi:hypothetical protein
MGTAAVYIVTILHPAISVFRCAAGCCSVGGGGLRGPISYLQETLMLNAALLF